MKVEFYITGQYYNFRIRFFLVYNFAEIDKFIFIFMVFERSVSRSYVFIWCLIKTELEILR